LLGLILSCFYIYILFVKYSSLFRAQTFIIQTFLPLLNVKATETRQPKGGVTGGGAARRRDRTVIKNEHNSGCRSETLL